MKERLLDLWRGLCMYGADFYWKVIHRASCIGLENVPKEGGVLICPNHISYSEPMLVPYFIIDAFGRFSKRRFWNPAKEELFNYGPFSWLLRSWRAFPVKRNARDLAAMSRIATLAATDMVMLYPEGTRSKTGVLGAGKPGVGKIIYDSRAAVVPAAVFNTRYCLPKGRLFPRLRLPLYVVYGKPLDLSRFYAMPPSRETSTLIVNEVMAAIRALLEEHQQLDLMYPQGQSQAQLTRAAGQTPPTGV